MSLKYEPASEPTGEVWWCTVLWCTVQVHVREFIDYKNSMITD